MIKYKIEIYILSCERIFFTSFFLYMHIYIYYVTNYLINVKLQQLYDYIKIIFWITLFYTNSIKYSALW